MTFQGVQHYYISRSFSSFLHLMKMNQKLSTNFTLLGLFLKEYESEVFESLRSKFRSTT